MAGVAPAVAQGSGYNLKHEQVELISRARRAGRGFVSVEELEAIRTGRRALPASKYGLESICGASCDTSAQ